MRELAARGVVDGEQLLKFAGPEGIVGACRWFDSLAGAPGVGVLVNAIKAGGKPGFQPRPRSALDRDREYLDGVVRWLNRHFPEYADDLGRPHPAAIVEVIHLHHRHGKGALTVSQHGAQVRRAVERFEARKAARG